MNHELIMRRCFGLAECGLGNVAPNPMVGAVLVKDGEIISEGFHQKSGGKHAEVVAMEQIEDTEILRSSVLYVNLEPCSHFGKTPPCTNLIISKKIKNVVFSNLDPNPLVNGKGMRDLTNSGINVISNILEKEGVELNRRFFTFHTRKRPYIILKWAQSADGFIAPGVFGSPMGKISWISGLSSRLLVHKWRAEEQAILAGRITVEKDNPRLTTRDWPGKNPTRIIIDPQLKIANTKHIYDQKANTIIVNSIQNHTDKKTTYVKVSNGPLFFKDLFSVLYKEDIQSVLVEGGAYTLESLLNANYWDEARVFTSKTCLGNGVKAPSLQGVCCSERDSDGDRLATFRNLRAN